MLRAAGLVLALAPHPQDPAPARPPTPGVDPQNPEVRAVQPDRLEPGPIQPGQVPQDPGRLLGPDRALEITIDGAYELALKRNLDLQIAATDRQIATYRARSSWGAFDWVLGARGTYADAEFQPRDVFGGGTETITNFGLNLVKPFATTGGTFRFGFDSTRSDTTSNFNIIPEATNDVVSLSYLQPLLRGGWEDYATSQQRLADFEAVRSDQAVRTARQRLLRTVADAYWDLVAAREQFDVAGEALKLAQAQVDQDTRRLEAGLGTEVEVLQAQADVALREEQKLLREFEVRTAADNLRKQLFPGTDPALWDTALIPGTPLPVEARADGLPPWTDAMHVAIGRRPELLEQRTRIAQAELRHDRSKSEKKPQLDLDLSAQGGGFSTNEGDAFDTSLTYDFPTYRASLVFGIPIGNNTARFAEKAAWAEIRRARLAYDQIEMTVVSEVRQAVRDVLYTVEAVRATQKSLELAQRQLAAEQARYAVDQSTNFQVLQFQTDLATAMSSERRARVQFARSLVRLQAAQGVLGDDLGS